MLATVLKLLGVASEWVPKVVSLVEIIRRKKWRLAQEQLLRMANEAEKKAFEEEMGFGG